MSSLLTTIRDSNRIWLLALCGFVFLAFVAIAIPPLHRSNYAAQHAVMDTAALVAYKDGNHETASVNSALKAGSTVMSLAAPAASAMVDRKMISTTHFDLTVSSPVSVAEDVKRLAESLGGYVESSQVSTSADAPSATMTIRVPVNRLEDVKADLRKLAVRVESESTDAKDVTKEYVDMEARLHNLRAEEAQYLVIMKSATKVKDMLEVSEKVSEVRGEIEQQQAEFATLSKQVETVALTLGLRAPVDTTVFGLQWRPLYDLKVAARDGLDGLASYVSAMFAIIFYLPVIALWAATILVAVVLGWRGARWVGTRLIAWKPAGGVVAKSV
jgi:hypothetical protein